MTLAIAAAREREAIIGWLERLAAINVSQADKMTTGGLKFDLEARGRMFTSLASRIAAGQHHKRLEPFNGANPA